MGQKLIARFSKSSNCGALQNRTLLVFQMKTGLRAELWKSDKIGWRSKPNEPISKAKFYEKDGDADLYRICEYFGFSLSDKTL